MGTIRYKVLQKFPLWRLKDDAVKVGMILELAYIAEHWQQAGGSHFFPDSQREPGAKPELTEDRLRFLIKHKFIEKVVDD